jgi:putative hemolysin
LNQRNLLQTALPASRQYQTMAGYLLHQFGKFPGVSDRIEAEGWRFEIVDLDGRRIGKMLATKVAEL